MVEGRFCRYELRTTDVEAARAFYANVLGAAFWDANVSLSPLPERAAARGAPAHWLGHIATHDVEETARRFVALGAERLGPTERAFDGQPFAVLRDPFGAVVAVSLEPTTPRRSVVAWHHLHTADFRGSLETYKKLFGWTGTEVADLGPDIGRHQRFSWDESGHSTGSMSNTVRLPHVHPHWLFFFAMTKVDESLAKVRAFGGEAPEPTKVASGVLVAPCHDPQGAAFGLFQSWAG
jgi:predicted enzyme related to lactoylglutathione lyase